MPKKIPIIDKIKKEIPVEWLASESRSSFTPGPGLCHVCRFFIVLIPIHLFLSVSGPTVQAWRVKHLMLTLPFCNDCVPEGSVLQGNMKSPSPKYICPHKKCDKTFLVDEFFEHLENTCSNFDFLDEEIKRLQNLKFADVKLKNSTKALTETKNKLQQNSVDIKRLEAQKRELTENETNLENEIKQYQADVAEINKLQGRRF
jgi:hypothetical protein